MDTHTAPARKRRRNLFARGSSPPALIAALAILCAAPGLAQAQQSQRAAAGSTEALFTFTEQDAFPPAADLSVTITRGGVVALVDAPAHAGGCDDPYCWPGGGIGPDARPSVAVADLDGDLEPEVLVDLFTGGAHCCVVAVIYRFDGAQYVASSHNFGDPGYRLGDLNGDGRPELISADARFAYRFASFAASSFPVRIFTYDQGTLRDATRAFSGEIRRDASRHWREYRRRVRAGGGEALGALAAWAADRYLLGQRAATLRTLRRLARAGQLGGDPRRSGARAVSDLDGFLRRSGYARR